MSAVFVPFMYLFNKYHKVAYKRVKDDIWVYFLAQLTLTFLFNYITNNSSEFVTDWDHFTNAGLFPVLQAICIWYIKSDEDLLKSVAKLDAICLVS